MTLPEVQDERYSSSLPSLARDLSVGYDGSLPYHNWQHGTSTALEALRIRNRLQGMKRDGLPSNFVLTAAGWGHDYGLLSYCFDNEGRASHEEYARDKTLEILSDYSVDSETLEEVGLLIMATSPLMRCRGLGQSIIRAADLRNIAGDYQYDFRDSMDLLCDEHRILKGNNISVIDYADIAIKILVKLLDSGFDFGEPRDDGYPFNFKKRALTNIKRFALDIAQEKGEETAEYVSTLGQTVLRTLRIKTPD